MKRFKENIECELHDKKTKRAEPFIIVGYVFNYQSSESDRILLDGIITSGTDLANKVNRGAASNASEKRGFETVKNNAIAGLLAEFAWMDFLKYHGIEVAETPFNEAAKQIDILILKTNKTIEVRSSFPRNGVRFALCNSKYQFDVIGPYSNNYKPGEIQKDFYTRALFPFSSRDLLARLRKDEFVMYLSGGATWAMMSDDDTAKVKSFIPEDELNLSRLKTKTNYRVVPFSLALDSLGVVRCVIGR